jgi:hypothetical protein
MRKDPAAESSGPDRTRTKMARDLRRGRSVARCATPAILGGDGGRARRRT